jgi:putative membrane protein
MKISKRELSMPLSALMSLLLPWMVACGGENSNNQARYPETTSAPMTAAPQGSAPFNPEAQLPSTTETPSNLTPTAPGAAPRPGYSEGASAPNDLGDPQIAEVATNINQGEIEQARYVVAHAKNPQVLQFARHMQTAHTELGQRMTSLLQTQGIALASSQLSNELKNNAQETLTTMESMSGRDLERDYIDAQVREHQAALDVLDNKLIPNAKDAQLKSFLEDVRSKVASHLAQAQNIQTSLATMK